MLESGLSGHDNIADVPILIKGGDLEAIMRAGL